MFTKNSVSKASVNLINLSTVQIIENILLRIGWYSEVNMKENIKISDSYTLDD